jgi:hypothetical protein
VLLSTSSRPASSSKEVSSNTPLLLPLPPGPSTLVVPSTTSASSSASAILSECDVVCGVSFCDDSFWGCDRYLDMGRLNRSVMADFTYSRNSDEMATECGVHNEQQGAKMEVCVV